MIFLLTPFTQCAHTLTTDNGKEFDYHEPITANLDIDFYFAHPYCSWERGLLCQHSCHIKAQYHAAFFTSVLSLSNGSEFCILHSGFKCTSSIRRQFLVLPDHRCG